MAQAGGEAMQSSFSEPQLEKLLERHGFLIYELLTPAKAFSISSIQRTHGLMAEANFKASRIFDSD